MNLHGTVRGAIISVNPDIIATFRRSTGNTSNADYSQTPSYAAGIPIRIQAQPVSGGALKHADALGKQGVRRTVYAYGNIQGVVRPTQQGGDLLSFPLVPNGPVFNWLTVEVTETWPDWCCFLVVLQTP